MNFYALKNLSHNKMVHDLSMIEHGHHICDGCLNVKQDENPFLFEVKYRAKTPLELWYSDLYGPITSSTHGGKR